MGLHSTWSDEVWLWRGQAVDTYDVEPGLHSRVRATRVPQRLALCDANVWWAARQLINRARENELDGFEGIKLPDLALLAHLQHHGAATPLLDVTVDPLVALWMAVNSTDPADDSRTGVLFAIRRPEPSRWLEPLDSRKFWDPDESCVVDQLSGLHWYRAPDVSERLRIQRGSFLVGPLGETDSVTTLPLNVASPGDDNWLSHRISRLGQSGQPPSATTDIVAFRVQARLKKPLRIWLDERAGLSQEVIYPTPWHRPFLDQFCRTYGRRKPIDYKVLWVVVTSRDPSSRSLSGSGRSHSSRSVCLGPVRIDTSVDSHLTLC